jgi:hypothetical protein
MKLVRNSCLVALLVLATSGAGLSQSTEDASPSTTNLGSQEIVQNDVVQNDVVKNEEVQTEPVVRRLVDDSPPMSGLVVVRDETTGKLRAPTAEEWERMASDLELLNQSYDGLLETQYPDGTVGITLDGRYQSMVLAHADEDGVSHSTCSEGPQALVDLILGQTSSNQDPKETALDR